MMFFWLLSCSSEPTTRSGAEVYSTYCVHCHQKNGQGLAKRYPPLAGSEWLQGDKPTLIVLHGLKGEIEVKGKPYNNVMAPWGSVLNDAEIAGVVNYIRSSWGNQLPLTTAEQVGQLRAKYEGHLSWRSETLKEK